MAQGAAAVMRKVLASTGVGQAIEGFDSAGLACLTFDDGPDPRGTVDVLEVLRERGARATFFVLGTRVRRYPGLLAEIVAEGHELAVHGTDHRDLIGWDAQTVRRLVLDARSEIEDAAGVAIRWFRPPYVALHADGWWALRRSGLQFVASGSAVHDWVHELDDAARIRRLRESFSPGDVILAHDAWAGPEDRGPLLPEPAVDRGRLCTAALDLIAERGLHPATLGEAASVASPRTAMRVSWRPRRTESADA